MEKAKTLANDIRYAKDTAFEMQQRMLIWKGYMEDISRVLRDAITSVENPGKRAKEEAAEKQRFERRNLEIARGSQHCLYVY